MQMRRTRDEKTLCSGGGERGRVEKMQRDEMSIVRGEASRASKLHPPKSAFNQRMKRCHPVPRQASSRSIAPILMTP